MSKFDCFMVFIGVDQLSEGGHIIDCFDFVLFTLVVSLVQVVIKCLISNFDCFCGFRR